MWRQTIARASAAGLAALALAGCSNSSAPKTVTIPFKSSALVHYVLPAQYTCEGRNESPPLEWGAVPSTTSELAIFMLALTPKRGGGGYTTTVAWALAGVEPQLHRLNAGELPPGAHVAVTDAGKRQKYSVCPPKGHTQAYQFALYAVPPTITVPNSFVGIKLLAVLASAESASRANAGGAFVANYTRPGRNRTAHRARG